MLNGYKTYVVGTLAIALGIYLETVMKGTGLELITLGLGFMGVRHAITKATTAAMTPTVIVEQELVEVPVACDKCTKKPAGKKTKK